MRRAFAALLILCTAAVSGAESDDTGLVIAPRSGSGVKLQKVWLQPSLSESAYVAEAAEAARFLSDDKLEAGTRAALTAGIRQDAERAAKAFVRCLDWQRYSDARARLGALRGIEIAGAPISATGKGLAGSAIAEPVPEVRNAAIDLIRRRKDAAAGGEILRFWRAAYDSDLGFDEPRRAAAAAAMRDIGDKRVFQALLSYVTLEVRAGSASGASIDTVNITGQGINLPIEQPGMNLISVEGTIIVPATGSLKQATGQDFGKNLAQWREWLDKQPDFQPR